MLLSEKKPPESIENIVLNAIACSCIVTYSSFDLIFKLDERERFTTAKHQSYHEHVKRE